MSDPPVIHFGENSSEAIAFKLFQIIDEIEANKTREEILDLYSECLRAVQNRLASKEKTIRNFANYFPIPQFDEANFLRHGP
jgi:hypothetical protein